MKLYEYEGNWYTAKELAAMAGVSYEGMIYRLRSFSVEDAVRKKFRTKVTYTYNGEEHSVRELSEIAGLSINTIRLRLANPRFKTVDEVVTRSFNKKRKRGKE